MCEECISLGIPWVNPAAHSDGGSGYLSLVDTVFILPFFLSSGYAGHLADVRSKRTVLIATKGFETVAMILYRIRIVEQEHVPFRGPALLF